MANACDRSARGAATGMVCADDARDRAPDGWTEFRDAAGATHWRCLECGAAVTRGTPAAALAEHAESLSHLRHGDANEAALEGRVTLRALPIGLLTAAERELLAKALGLDVTRALDRWELEDWSLRLYDDDRAPAARVVAMVARVLEYTHHYGLPWWVALERVRAVFA
jgi:hypothetical protein